MPRPYFHNKARHIDEILRVDHAGEYGAIRIYEGQLSSLRGAPKRDVAIQVLQCGSIAEVYNTGSLRRFAPLDDTIMDMLSQEQKHLKYFEDQIIKHHARPTIFLPLWNILGYAMGYVSALAGTRVAMLCTEAVEEVIDEHYKEQHELAIAMGEVELAKNIEKHRQDELEHKNTAIEYGSMDAVFYPYLKMAIGKLCKFAIFTSKII